MVITEVLYQIHIFPVHRVDSKKYILLSYFYFLAEHFLDVFFYSNQ
jgi:hypothetical protein